MVAKKRFYLIDLENVGRNGFDPFKPEDLREVKQTDTFVLFHNDLRGDLSPAIKKAYTVLTQGAQIRVIEIKNGCGKNAMDFCLASELGYLVCSEGTSAEYVIISKDRGFEACLDFARLHGIKLTVSPSVNSKIQRERTQEEERSMVKNLLPAAHKKVISVVCRGLTTTTGPGEYHNFLQKNLKEGEFTEVYQVTKHLVHMGR